jgi:serine protease Do
MFLSTLLPVLRKGAAAALAAVLIGAATAGTVVTPAFAQGPESVADLAEGLLGAVVNISTSQKVKGTEGPGAVPMPELPEGSPFQDFFDDFFKDRGGEGGRSAPASCSTPKKASSSPTTTSSPMPTRSRSIFPTVRSSRPN